MKVNRLFEIIYILLDKKTVTAKELAERLGVSVRTIYRDIDTLSMSNIPIYTSKGTGGGISILPNFVLNKSVLTEEEQKEILVGLQSLRAAGYPEIDAILGKVGSFFNKDQQNWIDVDFSYWGSTKDANDYFYMLKSAILNNKVVSFDYYNSMGEKSTRQVEPIQLFFKDRFWYLHGFCRLKNNIRVFKLSRVVGLQMLPETFINNHTIENKRPIIWGKQEEMMEVTLLFKKEIGYRVFDEFDARMVEKDEKGDLLLRARFSDTESTYIYFLSFGCDMDILAPKSARIKFKSLMKKINEKYEPI